jgi:DNA invertase Pin-like site-specific DNA recombinase
MNVDELIKLHGTVTRTAQSFGVSRTTVYQWKERGLPQQITYAMNIGAEAMARNLLKGKTDGED